MNRITAAREESYHESDITASQPDLRGATDSPAAISNSGAT
jgi:hypothetical protein